MDNRQTTKLIGPRLLLMLFCLQMPLLAQEAHDHRDHGAVSGLGTVHFPISCSEAAQTKFTRAVALLHSFGYQEARQVFSELAAQEPKCGMAYWGIAMSYYHPIWAPPTRQDLERGAAAGAQASRVSATTRREQDYIAAISIFYRDWQTVPHRKRGEAYLEAMKALHERYPNDDEAAIFYALVMRGLADDNDKTLAQQKRAAEILLAVLPRNPNHPGVAHYLIHSFDYPSLAEKALPAARVYAKIAPDAPHALHMPTHIFTRLGLWDESVTSNLASAASAKRRASRMSPGAASFDELHADDYLIYAWLQQAQDDRVLALIREMQSMTRVDDPQFAAAYAFAAASVRFALERQDWKAAAQLQVSPDWFPWSSFPHAVAIVSFGRALGCAHTGDLNGALSAIASLEELQRAEPASLAYDWKNQIEIQIIAAKSWVELARGNRTEALKLARQAADKEDSTEKSPVTPGAVRPARELLADMLLETSSPAEALAEYRAALKVTPRRYRSLAGAARAAGLAGDQTAAAGYSRELLTLAKGSTSDRPELRQAAPNMNLKQ
jgi:tetratricopeptide (TPR) repeat protein